MPGGSASAPFRGVNTCAIRGVNTAPLYTSHHRTNILHSTLYHVIRYFEYTFFVFESVSREARHMLYSH